MLPKQGWIDIKSALYYNTIIESFGNYRLGRNPGSGGTFVLVNGESLACGVGGMNGLSSPSLHLFHSLSDNRLLSVWLRTCSLFKGLIAPNLSGKDPLLWSCKVASKLQALCASSGDSSGVKCAGRERGMDEGPLSFSRKSNKWLQSTQSITDSRLGSEHKSFLLSCFRPCTVEEERNNCYGCQGPSVVPGWMLDAGHRMMRVNRADAPQFSTNPKSFHFTADAKNKQGFWRERMPSVYM